MKFTLRVVHVIDASAHPNHPAARPPWRQWLTSTLVLLFVCWHLLFLFLSNTTIKAKWIEETFGKYESYAGLDQQWGMFSSPLWRSLPFPAARIHFADGATELVRSRNEPADFTRFVRIGSTRQRKLEHYLITRDLTNSYQAPIQQRLAEWFARQWRRQHEGDARIPTRVTLLRLDYDIPKPGEQWQAHPSAVEREVVTIDLESH